jgi:uncharacterized membrane protein
MLEVGVEQLQFRLVPQARVDSAAHGDQRAGGPRGHIHSPQQFLPRRIGGVRQGGGGFGRALSEIAFRCGPKRSFAGTLYFVALQLVVSAGWVLVNTGLIPGIAPFDPFPFPLLSSITSLEAVLLTAFVLIKQNRMSTIADRRDHIDLQVNLLSERETTRIIQMLDRVSTHLGIEQHHDADSREMGQHIAVEHLVDELDRRMTDSKP